MLCDLCRVFVPLVALFTFTAYWGTLKTRAQWWGKQGGTSRCLWGGNYPLLNCALWIIHCLPNLTLPPKSSSIMCLLANLLTYRLIRKKNPKTVENLLANSSLLSPLISRATTFLKLCNGLMSRKKESLQNRDTTWHPSNLPQKFPKLLSTGRRWSFCETSSDFWGATKPVG